MAENELKAACERVREFYRVIDHNIACANEDRRSEALSIPYTGEMYELPKQRVQDLCVIERAYLAEHPADGEQAIDEAWLRSVGFESCPNESVIATPDSPSGLRVTVNISPTIRFGRVTVKNESLDYPAANGSAYVNNQWTRGRMRHLCQALVIELKG